MNLLLRIELFFLRWLIKRNPGQTIVIVLEPENKYTAEIITNSCIVRDVNGTLGRMEQMGLIEVKRDTAKSEQLLN